MKQVLLMGSILVVLFGCQQKQNEYPQDQMSNPEYNQGEAPLYWTGPGWYGGVWFETEIEFNNWHDHHHDHDRHGDHHGGHGDSRGGDRGGHGGSRGH